MLPLPMENYANLFVCLPGLTYWSLFGGENGLELRVICTSRQIWGVWSTTEAEGWNVQRSPWSWGKRETCQNAGQSEASGPPAPENMGSLPLDWSMAAVWFKMRLQRIRQCGGHAEA